MVITLCGSNRFEDYFKIWNEVLSLAGHTVFTTSVYPSFKRGVKDWYTEEEKNILDLVHLSKIDSSDAILVLNVCAYIGESTLNEINYAKMRGKKMFALESWGTGCGIGNNHTPEVQMMKSVYEIGEDYKSPINTTSDWFGFAPNLATSYISGHRREALIKRLDVFKEQELEFAKYKLFTKQKEEESKNES